MKHYYLYIDESGNFKKSKNPKKLSFVGGFLTEKTPEELLSALDLKIKEFQHEHGEILSYEDIHAAEIMHPETYPSNNGLKKKRYLSIPQDKRKKFIQSITEIVLDNSQYIIRADNKRFNFSNEDPQAKYGACLGALFREALRLIVEEKKIKLSFLIAGRNKICLPENENLNDYNEKLRKNFRDNANESGMVEVIDINTDIEKIKRLLSLADIACYWMMNGKDKKLYKTKPNQLNFEKEIRLAKKSKLNKLLTFVNLSFIFGVLLKGIMNIISKDKDV